MKTALRKENVRSWHEVESDFLECEYRAVRDRQMQELEKEDDVMSKVPIRFVVESLLSYVYTHPSITETFEPNCTKSHSNLCDNNGFIVCCTVLGL